VFEDVERVNLAKNRGRLVAVMNTVMNQQARRNMRIFVTSLTTLSPCQHTYTG